MKTRRAGGRGRGRGRGGRGRGAASATGASDLSQNPQHSSSDSEEHDDDLQQQHDGETTGDAVTGKRHRSVHDYSLGENALAAAVHSGIDSGPDDDDEDEDEDGGDHEGEDEETGGDVDAEHPGDVAVNTERDMPAASEADGAAAQGDMMDVADTSSSAVDVKPKPTVDVNAAATNTNAALAGAAAADTLEAKLDKPLLDFLQLLEDGVEPVVPDAVTDFYLARAGFDCPDKRINRLMALAAQKFISDLAQDAYQYCKIRQQAGKDRRAGSSSYAASSSSAARNADKKTVLTMEDLSAALGEYGINVKRPDYYT